MTATHTIRGACANHPDKPGSVAHPDGTFRCDPCHDEPVVTAWETATGDHTCPCGGPIRTGDRVAVLDTAPKQRVCVECTDAA